MKARIPERSLYRLSACTIAKNEEESIARSIDSYRDFVDEIIVVDTGSTDDTVRIAKEHGARVLHFDWCNDFAAAKNFALDHVEAGDWIIFLDADEYFCPDCGKRLKEAIVIAEKRGHDCIGCRMKNLDRHTGEMKAEIMQIRVFKKGLCYQNAIHESLRGPGGASISPLTVHESWFFLYHTGYSDDLFANKARRNAEILQQQLEQETNPAVQCVYHLYLCDSYMSMGDPESAKEEAMLYFRDKDRYDVRATGMQVKIYLVLLRILRNEHPYSTEEEEKWVGRLLKEFPNHPDAVFAHAQLLARKRCFRKALERIEEAERLSETYDDMEVNALKVQNAQWLFLRGICQEGIGEFGEAFLQYRESLKYREAIAPASRLGHFLKQQKPEEVEHFLEDVFPSFDGEQMKCLMAGLMANYMSEALLLCYAKYRLDEKQESVDANISAFIQAGKGSYKEAASFFLLRYQADHSEDTAVRALLCAYFAQDEDCIEQVRKIAPPYCEVLFGGDVFSVQPDWVPKLAGVVAETERMKGERTAVEMASFLLKKLDEESIRIFALALEKSFSYAAAFAVADQLSVTPETLFLRGYYLCRMGRFGAAEDLLILAKEQGYAAEEADAVLGVCAEGLCRFRADKKPDVQSEQARIAKHLHEEKFGVAQAALEVLRDLAEPDAEWYSMAAVTLYYLGQNEQAALMAEAGLLRFPDNADLAYNAGDVYKRMGLQEQAKGYYQKALDRCSNEDLRAQIRQAMDAVPV